MRVFTSREILRRQPLMHQHRQLRILTVLIDLGKQIDLIKPAHLVAAL